ncbi:MAG: MFS transporter [Hyphomonadaceae bacterium]|nr:MFS transporter [Hyphomonadaceae bacterium]MBP9233543.1 MFS transporter [Hyphomonadaceae bacterium]
MTGITAASPSGDPIVRFLTGLGVHYAWVVAFVTFFAALVAAGAVGSVGVMLLPLQMEFGWTQAEISSALAIRLALLGLVAPFAAALFIRFGLRPIIVASLVLIAAGTGGSIYMTALWQLVALWGVVVGLAAGLTALVMSATVATRWFETRRGLVIGILSAATAMGQLVFLPLMAWLVKAQGWRTATLALCVFYAVAVALVVIFIRNRPSDVGLRPFGAAPDSPIAAPPAPQGNLFLAPFEALAVAARKPIFWILAGSFFVCGASTNGLVQMHLIPMCGDYMIPATAAAGTLALMGGFNFVGTVASGWLTDRFNPRILLMIYYGLRGLSLFYLTSTGFESTSLLLFAVFYGLDWIATVPPTVKLAADAFGPARATLVFGWIFAAHQLGAGLAAFVAGVIRTEVGSYALAFQGAGILCIIAALAFVGGRRQAKIAPAAA